MLVLLHAVFWLGVEHMWARPLLLAHLGLFLIWQPLWRSETRAQLPEPWPEQIGKAQPQDGSEYELYSRVVALDPLKQQVTRQMRTLLWRDGRVTAEQEYTLTENLYFRNELCQILERAGFSVEAIQGGFQEVEATAEDDVVVFLARKV